MENRKHTPAHRGTTKRSTVTAHNAVAAHSAVAARSAVALCGIGTEKAVSNELKKLDISVIESGFGRVRFHADTTGLYRSLMGLRAADRVLLEIGQFHAADFDALFDETGAVAWEKLVPAHLGVKVAKVRANRSRLRSETSIQAMVHKAVAQRLCRAYSLVRLPETDTAAELRVYIEKDMVSLLLDLSGDPLFKRGYRKKGGIAPLRETTAAALLLLSGWKRKYPLYDPFCGSGTILAEAQMYAWDMAPGLGRDFAISKLLIADGKIEEKVRDEFRAKINYERRIRIAGSDADIDAVRLATANLWAVRDIADDGIHGNDVSANKIPELRQAPMDKAQSLFETDETDETAGFIVTNPPYGKRLGNQAESQRVYAEMAVLTRNFPGWKLAVICDHPGFESFFGRKADSCREISNGPDPSYFFQYGRL
ncbi:MAG: N-6 DNA methylase [Treponema sp.]|nr:N-6 DNA methylase [Treponema sp.]